MTSATIYDVEITFENLPAASQVWILKEGVTHGAGNRVAAKVIGDFRAQARKAWVDANSAEAWKALDKAEQSKIEKLGIPDPDDESYRNALTEGRKEFFAALADGTLGEGRQAGPRKSPLEIEMEAIAKRETFEIFVKQGLFVATSKRRVPKADDEFNIKGETLDYSSWCERRLARNSARIEAQARKILAERDKAANKAGAEALEEAF